MDFVQDIIDVIVKSIKWLTESLGLALLAIKALVMSVVFTLVSVLTKVSATICIDFVDAELSKVDIVSAATIEFKGLAGYLISATRLDDCLYIILGAILTRFILSFVPFK